MQIGLNKTILLCYAMLMLCGDNAENHRNGHWPTIVGQQFSSKQTSKQRWGDEETGGKRQAAAKCLQHANWNQARKQKCVNVIGGYRCCYCCACAALCFCCSTIASSTAEWAVKWYRFSNAFHIVLFCFDVVVAFRFSIVVVRQSNN